MELGLRNKVAIVTGGTRGIGNEIARDLAREGAKVAICGRDPQTCTEAAKSIESDTSSRTLGIAADVSSRNDVARLVADVLEHFGRIDILVNNAGTHVRGTIDDYNEADLDRHLHEKLFGFMAMIHEVAATMRKQRDGRIVNIIGPAGRHPHPDRLISGVVNAALLALSKSAADALAPDNIRVNAVSPQGIEGSLVDRIVSEEMRKHGVSRETAISAFTRANVLHRLGKREEVSAVVAFLVSDAANFVCGSNVAVDGGYQRYVY